MNLADWVVRLGKIIDTAKGAKRIWRNPGAEELWGRDHTDTGGMYAELNRDPPGLYGIVTARAAPQVLRLR